MNNMYLIFFIIIKPMISDYVWLLCHSEMIFYVIVLNEEALVAAEAAVEAEVT